MLDGDAMLFEEKATDYKTGEACVSQLMRKRMNESSWSDVQVPVRPRPMPPFVSWASER